MNYIKSLVVGLGVIVGIVPVLVFEVIPSVLGFGMGLSEVMDDVFDWKKQAFDILVLCLYAPLGIIMWINLINYYS